MYIFNYLCTYKGFPDGIVIKNPPADAGDTRDAGSIHELGRSPEEGVATHSSILAWRIPTDRGAWRATVHGVTKSQRSEATEQLTLSLFTFSTDRKNNCGS